MLGTGLIKGMAVTARNFLGSYLHDDRLVTVEYPERVVPPKENARSFPFLVYDGDEPSKGLRCVACQICEKECPPQCIYIVKDTVKKPDYLGKLQNQPKVFDVDLSVCMSCQICVEVCPFDAIRMDTAFELSTGDRFDGLIAHKHELAKPNEYYHKVHPTEALETDERRNRDLAKAEAKARPPVPAAAPSAQESVALSSKSDPAKPAAAS